MPNTFAYVMLLLWPVVCLGLFRRLPVERAVIWSLLGGYLLLPPRAAFDFPLVPDFDKTSIPSLCALLFCLTVARRRMAIWPDSRAPRVLMVLFVFGTIPTVLTNAEPISFTTGALPGLRWIDVLSVISGQMIALVPFVLGRSVLASATGQRELLLALALGGLAYSLPALVEVRLSPQLNIWIYGFFQHSFSQMMRDGGFRPLVFLPHALWMAFFLMTAALAAAALARTARGAGRGGFAVAVVWLAGVLVLCKSLAAMLYALVLVPLVLIVPPRLQIRGALVLAFLAVLYPALRENAVVPLDAILERAAAIDPDRAQSLAYRFDNEEQLLARAGEKRLFGWGGWGRNLARDPRTGEIVTIPDGQWIITFGTFGWVGYVSLMGLLAGPLVMLWRGLGQRRLAGGARWRPLDRAEAARDARARHVAALALILAITLFDMLINAILTPYTWLIAGALLGHCEAVARDARAGGAARPRRRPAL